MQAIALQVSSTYIPITTGGILRKKREQEQVQPTEPELSTPVHTPSLSWYYVDGIFVFFLFLVF